MEAKDKKRCTAIILAAGQGKRMGADVQKQYIELEGKPVIYYSLKAFQDSEIIDDIILVVGSEKEIHDCSKLVKEYHFTKVDAIVLGGKERYDSVWQALKVIQDGRLKVKNQDGYVFIHDGVRLFVDGDIIRRGYETVRKCKACVAGMPCKDTIKLVDEEDCTVQTPERKYVRAVQTPQVFETSLIIEAYSRLMREESISVTDDGMVVEQMMNVPVLGLIENYSYVQCPHCGEPIKVFGESHIDEVAAKYGLKVLGRIPLDPQIASLCDRGVIELFEGDWLEEAADAAEAAHKDA